MLDTMPQKVATCLTFMPARNCEMYAAEAIRSLSRQTMDDIFVLYVDDASEDHTGQIAQQYLQELFPGRHEYIRNPVHFGKSKNVWEHLRPRAHLAEFITVLDADDQLIDVTVLDAMAKSYASGSDVVWTNFITDTGYAGLNAALDPSRSPRDQRWLTSHFFSFRAALLPNVPESYFKDSKGAWFMGACDVSLAMPILDQTRNYKFIPALSYRYTMSNPLSLHNSTPAVNAVTSELQLNNANEIRARAPLPLATQAPADLPDLPDSAAAPVSAEVLGDLPTAAPTAAKAKEHPPAMSKPVSASLFQVSGSSLWADQAATLLTTLFPSLLTAQSMGAESALSPLELWAMAAQLEQVTGEVLFLGTPEAALCLAALTTVDPERKLTCLLEPTGAQDLRNRLRLAGLSARVEVIAGKMSTVTMEEKHCAFPSIAGLQGKGPFSIVFVDPRGAEDEETFSAIALPAVSECLAEGRFRYGALSSDTGAAQRVVQTLAKLTVGVDYCLGALGGTGFLAAPATPATPE